MTKFNLPKKHQNYTSFNRKVSQEIKSIVKNYNPDKIIVFGSYANNTMNKESDMDLIIIKNTKEKFLDRINKVLESMSGCAKFDVLVYNEKEIEKMLKDGNDFLETALKEGIIIYEK